MTRTVLLALALLLACADTAGRLLTSAADSRYAAGAITQAHERYATARLLAPWHRSAHDGYRRCLADAARWQAAHDARYR